MKKLQMLPALLLVGTPACAQNSTSVQAQNTQRKVPDTAPKIETRVAFQTLPKPQKSEDNVVFPEDSGVANVVKDYGADPTGKTDSTRAIQQALTEKKAIVYLPNGVYLVSDTLNWGDRQNRQILQGQSEGGTILKLADNAPGYGSPTTPKSVVWTGKAPAQRFRNGIRNLTIDTGKGNAGAIGAQYIANNQGAIHHLTIRSGDGSGVIGLDLGYTDEQGPCLIKDVTVRGFDTGIFMKHAVDGVVLENIRVENQNVAGLVNDGQSVSMRGFSSQNAVPAIQNKAGASMLALDLADIQGTGDAKNLVAIENGAGLFARNISTSGYRLAIDNNAGKAAEVVGPKVSEFVSHPIESLFPSPPRSLNLPVKDTPEPATDPLSEWINVRSFEPKKTVFTRPDGKKVNYDDWTEAIQKAIDSGKSTIYFPAGPKFVITGEVFVRGNVKRLIGLDADAWNKPGGLPSGTFVFQDTKPGITVFERFDTTYSGLKFRQESKNPLVFSSVLGNEHVTFEKKEGTGDVFLEDVCLGAYTQKGGNTYSRQLNLEGWEIKTKYLNDGGNAWILGLKTEDDTLLHDVRNGGKSEIVGGFIYANKARNPEKIMFSITDAAMSFSLGEWVIRNQPFNPVRETRGGQTRTLKAGEVPKRGGGGMVPLFVGYQGNAAAPPTAPEKVVATTKGTGQIDLSWTPKPGADGILLERSSDGQNWTTLDTLTPETASYSLSSGLKAGTEYSLRLTAFNAKGQAASPVIKATTLPPAPIGTGTGLRGDYFADKSFNSLKTTRTDAGINFDWKTVPLPEGVSGDNLSVRWTGFLEPRFSESFEFSTERQGTRLWVGDELILDGWNRRNWTGRATLEAGKKAPIKLEIWSEKPGPAASLMWQSLNVPKEAIPAAQLYPSQTALPGISWSQGANFAENSGKPITVTVTRSGDTKAPLAVRYRVGGNANPGDDYQPFPGVLNFAAGAEKATINFTVPDNKKAQPNRTIVFSLAPSASYNQNGNGPTFTIQDDDLPPAGNGTGLKGEYFDDRKFETVTATRVDATLDSNWQKSPPIEGITLDKKSRDKNGFSVRWSGEILPQFSEKYQFELNFGNYAGARMWIGDTLVIDAWDKGKVRTGVIELKAGQKVPIKIEMEQRNFYDHRMQLKWSSPSQFEQIVPKSQLFPAS